MFFHQLRRYVGSVLAVIASVAATVAVIFINWSIPNLHRVADNARAIINSTDALPDLDDMTSALLSPISVLLSVLIFVAIISLAVIAMRGDASKRLWIGGLVGALAVCGGISGWPIATPFMIVALLGISMAMRGCDAIRFRIQSGRSAPATQPVQPMAQPVQPMAQPAQPMAQPAQPMAQPAQPMAQPAQPMAQPAQPATQPAQPMAQPAQPMAQAAEQPAEQAAPTGSPEERPIDAASSRKVGVATWFKNAWKKFFG